MPQSNEAAVEVLDSDTVGFVFRKPKETDGEAVLKLVAECPPLDLNSLYAYLLQCAQFSDTCRVAELDGKVVGWISGHRLPSEPDVLFIWQVAVHPDVRGEGLGVSLLDQLLVDAQADGIRRLKTSITEDNKASWGLFEAIADDLNAALTSKPWFGRETHFGGRHDTEHLVTIGPIKPSKA